MCIIRCRKRVSFILDVAGLVKWVVAQVKLGKGHLRRMARRLNSNQKIERQKKMILVMK
jgi:hypothetical protein